ncbi:MAG TPA: MASE1 domain-containing protein [Gaiellaceae bacterium]|nr:MASE1 domain-containing protein [Gaiellaceae bacterium]
MRGVLILTGVAAAYVGAAKIGLELSVAQGIVTPVWAPTGIALAAAVLLGPRRAWPAVAAGAFIANAISGASLPLAAVVAAGNTLEAVAGALLLRRAAFRPALDRVRDVLALVVLGAIVSTTISATNGVTALLVANHISIDDYGSKWVLWWTGDGMGDLVVAPLILVWAAAPPRGLPRRRQIEAVALVAALATVASAVFFSAWRYRTVLFPLLIWPALRFRQLGAVTASFICAVIAVGGAVHGNVPFGHHTGTETVVILEGLLATVTVSLMFLGAVLSERDTAERQLASANASLAEAQQVAHIGSWEWKIGDHRITWSDELYRLFGLEPGSGMNYEAYLARLHPDDAARTRALVSRAADDGEAFSFDHRVVWDDGTVRWLHGRGRVVVGADGRPVRMVGTAQDITERHKLDELRDTILSTVSHELRTPLTAILGFAVTLKEHGAGLPVGTYATIVDHLVEQAMRLERLLADLLDLDRLRHGVYVPTFRPTDVSEIVRRTAARYGGDGHVVRVRTEPAVADVDAPKVERIVENLLANSVKHTPPGTEILVRAAPADGGVQLAVADSGPGVPAESREAVFELFTRGNGTDVPGTGVGLSLVAQFAALHGGRAWVEDAPGGGAEFRVWLPARQP